MRKVIWHTRRPHSIRKDSHMFFFPSNTHPRIGWIPNAESRLSSARCRLSLQRRTFPRLSNDCPAPRRRRFPGPTRGAPADLSQNVREATRDSRREISRLAWHWVRNYETHAVMDRSAAPHTLITTFSDSDGETSFPRAREHPSVTGASRIKGDTPVTDFFIMRGWRLISE